ncbi:hypothetical protein RDWZM_009826 [Blomia tropicalis]|uniref:Elongation of very long chain fatty acids protein n=1 Tax=Blomia tropicalis TaxID=40697 RepID=A0A9Q0M4D7_BLOTA|nr:hypothetical protein RDWZM_009584 [Blomia tropicalis]KAJ6218669.1 hypothetical protein RDWZM_009826 [Blomia tropicalis]
MDNFRLESPQSSIYSPNYSFAFKFENEHNYRKTAGWMGDNWHTSFYYSLAYVTFIFFGKIYMSTRPEPFRLKGPLALWNVRISSFWTWLFILSKAPELIDTVFVVLRKQKLIFLHWYHHATVLIFTWYAYADEASTGRWYSTMNYSVHAVMYTYYALRACGIKIPRQLAMSITISQILQMIMGTYVTIYAYYCKSMGQPCGISFSTLYAGIAIYISYFILFAQFFISSYFGGSKSSSKKEKKVQ